MEQFLAPASSVSETVAFQEFRMIGDKQAECKVLYTTKLETFSRVTGKVELSVMQTKCLDEWKLGPRGWLLVQSRVLAQDYTR